MIFSGIPIWIAVSIAAGAVTVLAVLHFLHRNYSRVPVPTLIFWRSVIESQRRNRLLGQFHRPLTLLFLAIIALLMIFSMTRPALNAGNQVPVRHVIIMDCRASMGLVDSGQTQNRMSRAKAICDGFIKSSADTDEIVLVAVSDSADVVGGTTDTQAACTQALNDLQVSSSLSETGLRQAIRIAESMIAEKMETRILLFTDHARQINPLPANLQPRLSLFNVAGPVSNLSLLQAEIGSQQDKQVQVEIVAGFWGEAAIQGTFELYENDVLLQKQDFSMPPNTVQRYSFMVDEPPAEKFVIRAVCKDDFAGDNDIIVIRHPGYKVYVAQDMPVPLKSCVDAGEFYFLGDSLENSDVSIIRATQQSKITNPTICLVADQGEPLASISRIVPTAQLFSDENKRSSMGTDLYSVGGRGLSGLSVDATALLKTEDGRVLAAVDGSGSASIVYLAESLFSEQSTLWKQPQFPEIFKRFVDIVCDNAAGRNAENRQVDPLYADLWNVDSAAKLGTPAELPNHSVPLYRMILIAAALLLGIEMYSFYRGIIV